MIETRDINGDMCIDPIQGALSVNGVGNATAVSHLLFTISNLNFKNSSMINFVLFIDDKELASIPLYVRKAGGT